MRTREKRTLSTRSARIMGVFLILSALFFGFLRVRVLSLGYAEGLTPPCQFVPYLTGFVLGLGVRLLFARNEVNSIVALAGIVLTLIFLLVEEFLIAQGVFYYLTGANAGVNQMLEVFIDHLRDHPTVFLWLTALVMAAMTGIIGTRYVITDEAQTSISES